jgi:hypothetical protein
MTMDSGFWDMEGPAIMGIVSGTHAGLVIMGVAFAIAGWAVWRRIARLNAAKLALDEQLRLAKDSQAEAIQKLTIAEARFQELYAKIKASEGFVSLASSAGGVARSISDLGKAHHQLAAMLGME